MLPVEPSYDTTLAEPAYSLAVRWDTSRYISDITKLDFVASDVGTFNSNQKGEQSVVTFLRSLTLL
jgi:leukotriene-A4 hydrolase